MRKKNFLTSFDCSTLLHQQPPIRFNKENQKALCNVKANWKNAYSISLWEYTQKEDIYSFISKDFQNTRLMWRSL